MTKDKRKYFRIPFSADATLLVIDSPSNISIQTRIRNVSFSGICLSSPEAVDTGSRVVIKIESKDQEKKEVVEGMVAWNIELKNGYDLGIFFSSHQSQYATAL